MRGRSCTQPFLVEKSACRPDALLLPPRWANRSPPHPTRLRRPTYGLWWLRLDLTEQSPGLFDPRGEGFGAVLPFPSTKPPPQPAQPVGGPLRAWDTWAAGQAKKKEPPRRVPPTRKGGSREEEPLPPWCSFLRLSSKESRAPPPESAGPPGRCAPRVASALPTWRVPPPRPPKKSTCKPLYSIV